MCLFVWHLTYKICIKNNNQYNVKLMQWLKTFDSKQSKCWALGNKNAASIKWQVEMERKGWIWKIRFGKHCGILPSVSSVDYMEDAAKAWWGIARIAFLFVVVKDLSGPDIKIDLQKNNIRYKDEISVLWDTPSLYFRQAGSGGVFALKNIWIPGGRVKSPWTASMVLFEEWKAGKRMRCRKPL